MNNAPVFKYVTREVARIILANQTMRWSAPSLFDDPLDVARSFDLGFPLQELEDALAEELNAIYLSRDVEEFEGNPLFYAIAKHFIESGTEEQFKNFLLQTQNLFQAGLVASEKHLEALNEDWKEMLPQMRLLCFSKRMDIIPMWATYGENHKGVVLEFHPQTSSDSRWLLAEPVTYTDEPFQMATPKEWARSALGIEKIDHSKIFQRYGCVKTTNWAYQEEVRVFSFKRSYETGNYSDYKFVPSDLKKIYFGYQCPDESVQAILALLQHDFSHVTPYRCYIDYTERAIKTNMVEF